MLLSKGVLFKADEVRMNNKISLSLSHTLFSSLPSSLSLSVFLS